MQQMREAVGIEKELRRLRTPGATGPNTLRTLALPKTAFKMLDARRSDHHQTDQQSRPDVLLVPHRGSGSALAKRIEAVSELAITAGKHGCVAQREAARFGFAQLLKEVKKISRLVGFEDDHKLLVIEAE